MSDYFIRQLRADFERANMRLSQAKTELSLAQVEYELARENLENALLYKKGYLTDV